MPSSLVTFASRSFCPVWSASAVCTSAYGSTTMIGAVSGMRAADSFTRSSGDARLSVSWLMRSIPEASEVTGAARFSLMKKVRPLISIRVRSAA